MSLLCRLLYFHHSSSMVEDWLEECLDREANLSFAGKKSRIVCREAIGTKTIYVSWDQLYITYIHLHDGQVGEVVHERAVVSLRSSRLAPLFV